MAQRPIDIAFDEKSIRVTTGIYQYQYESSPTLSSLSISSKRSKSTPILVDLYSMIHVADRKYYRTIETIMSSYDIVLYELITDQTNIAYLDTSTSTTSSTSSTSQSFKKILTRDIMSLKVNDLANSLNLNTQLSLNMRQKNWYIADLDSTTVQSLERENIAKVNWNYWQSIIAGRASAEKLLKSFFFPDITFITILRLFLWMIPCPELSSLAVDWSRMSPKAGGVSPLLSSVVQYITSGRLIEAKKLAFAQQLMSGVADDGSWGGMAKSDISVRVKARNQECCRVLSGFLQELSDKRQEEQQIMITEKEKPRMIAVLYGAYHVKDLQNRFASMGLSEIPGNECLTAWHIERESDRLIGNIDINTSSTTNNIPLSLLSPHQNNSSPVYKVDIKANTVLGLTFIAYLIVGALDWSIMLRLISEAIEEVTNAMSQVSTNMNDGSITETLTIGYAILYVQRHLWLQSTISSVGIQWDRGLFE